MIDNPIQMDVEFNMTKPLNIKFNALYNGGGGSSNIPDPPTTSGIYDLRVRIVDGAPVYDWVRTNPMYVMYSNSINRSVSEVNYTMEVTVNDT